MAGRTVCQLLTQPPCEAATSNFLKLHGEVLGRGTHPFHRNMSSHFLLPRSVVTVTALLSCSLLIITKLTADHVKPSSPRILFPVFRILSYWLPGTRKIEIPGKTLGVSFC